MAACLPAKACSVVDHVSLYQVMVPCVSFCYCLSHLKKMIRCHCAFLCDKNSKPRFIVLFAWAEMPVFRIYPDFRTFCTEGSVPKYRQNRIFRILCPMSWFLMLLPCISPWVNMPVYVVTCFIYWNICWHLGRSLAGTKYNTVCYRKSFKFWFLFTMPSIHLSAVTSACNALVTFKLCACVCDHFAFACLSTQSKPSFGWYVHKGWAYDWFTRLRHCA